LKIIYPLELEEALFSTTAALSREGITETVPAAMPSRSGLFPVGSRDQQLEGNVAAAALDVMSPAHPLAVAP